MADYVFNAAGHLESSGQLMIFVLDEDSCAYDSVECRIVGERRPRQVTRDRLFSA